MRKLGVERAFGHNDSPQKEKKSGISKVIRGGVRAVNISELDKRLDLCQSEEGTEGSAGKAGR